MNENHLQRLSFRKLFQNGCKFNKNDYSERKNSQGTIFAQMSALNGAILLVFVFFFIYFEEFNLYFFSISEFDAKSYFLYLLFCYKDDLFVFHCRYLLFQNFINILNFMPPVTFCKRIFCKGVEVLSKGV